MEYALIALCGVVVYVYAGYPALIALLGTLRPRPIRKDDSTPGVTVIIPAYNEAAHIGATIENKLAQNYPSDKLQIIVVSDCSDDGTDEIVAKYESEGVTLIRQEERRGKTAALNLAVPEARGEILVFSDANSMYDENAVRALVANFADPQVGYVTGKMVYVTTVGSSVSEGCGGYMKYENAVRRMETKIGSIVGVDGGVDAARAELYREIEPSQLPDFVLPLNVVESGYRVVYEPEAVLREDALSAADDEYRMRVRVSLRAFRALWHKRALFNIFRFGLFSAQLFSHKLLRYLVGPVMAAIFTLTFLVDADWQPWFLAAQVVFYAMAGVGYLLNRAGRETGAFNYPFYFVLINLAAFAALLGFVRGKRQATWTPRGGAAR